MKIYLAKILTSGQEHFKSNSLHRFVLANGVHNYGGRVQTCCEVTCHAGLLSRTKMIFSAQIV